MTDKFYCKRGTKNQKILELQINVLTVRRVLLLRVKEKDFVSHRTHGSDMRGSRGRSVIYDKLLGRSET